MKKKKSGAAFLTAALICAAAAFCLSGCKAAETGTQAETESVSEETDGTKENIRELTMEAQGNSDRMVESGGRLYFRFGNTLNAIDLKENTLETLHTFGEGESGGTFWVYRGSLYFDCSRTDGSTDLVELLRLDLETGEIRHQADLMAAPMALYASDGLLYVRNYDISIVYRLDENGDTDGELAPAESVYGQIPAGCRELYSGMLPNYLDHLSYMPVQNDRCLVIAEPDGGRPREVPEISNTSSVLFAEDEFFAVFRDGNGNSRCTRYDAETLEPTDLFESDRNVDLIQYRDGYLYGMQRNFSEMVCANVTFFRIPADGREGAEWEKLASVQEEPGMTGTYPYGGTFYAAETGIYCQQFHDYGLYMSMVNPDTGEETLLEPMLFESPLQELGTVEAHYDRTDLTEDGSIYTEYYIEEMKFAGEGEAVQKMNQEMERYSGSLLEYAKQLSADTDEELLQSGLMDSMTLSASVSGIEYLDENLCCIGMTGYEYSGGAHGMPFRDYFTFDRKTGNRLKLSDLMNTSEDELRHLVAEAFRKMAEATSFSFEAPEDLEHTISETFSYDASYYLTETGIAFYYVPYEIAPYAAGFPEIVIPYEALDLKPVLSPADH